MSMDGIYSYIHFDDPNKVVYMENWVNETLPFDDIDTTNLIEKTAELFAHDDEEDEMNLSTIQFGSKSNKNGMNRNRKWMDLNIEQFLKDSEKDRKLIDQTLLPGLTNVGDLISNGYDQIDNTILSPAVDTGDLSINSTTDYVNHANNTFLNLRSHLNPQTQQQPQHQQQQQQSGSTSSVFQTPRPGRVRQVSSDKFQTPISRIMR